MKRFTINPRGLRKQQLHNRRCFNSEIIPILSYKPVFQVIECVTTSSDDDLPFCLAEPPSIECDTNESEPNECDTNECDTNEECNAIKENEMRLEETDKTEMKTKVINFVGAPSVGKTTMSALIFAELKHMHKTAELVQEYAKILVWQQRFEELDNQYQVSMEQYKMLKAVDGKVEYAVMDSPLFVGMFYNRTYETNVCNVEKTEAMILSKMAEFENIYIYLERNEEFPYEKQGRVHNEEQSRQIEKQMLELLEEHNIKYLRVQSSKRSIPMIMEYIKNSKSY
jgi:nicotinamide riboside kinase